jgi:uncharacterized protein
MKTVKPMIAALMGVAVLALAVPGHALAEGRDPAYAAARAAGEVGEMPNGYLGAVAAPASPTLKRMVEDINIKRKAIYVEKAQAQRTTVEDYAFFSGCHLISATVAGEKYTGTQGRWLTRDGGAPVRDSRCL